MALQKYVPLGNAPSFTMKPLSFSTKVHEKSQPADPETSPTVEPDVDIDLREVYFLIMHFLSAGPCHRTYGQFWNELLEHQLLPRRYHAWYSRNGAHSGDENDNGLSFPLSYNKLVERYPHVEKDHLIKLLKQLILSTAPPAQGMSGGNAPNAADVPTLLGTGSFSLLDHDRIERNNKLKHPPSYMRWPHMQADQVRGLSLREIGGGFARHHRAPSIRAACYAIAKPSTMVQTMQNIKRIRGHRNAVYCAIFDRSGRYVITGSDDRLVKIWSMESAYCLASCRGHEGDITDLAVSSNNALVASSSNDCIIRVWRLPDGLPISVLRGHTGVVTAIAFSPRSSSTYQLLSSSDDGTCRIWDARYSQFGPRIYTPRPPDTVLGRNNGPSSSSAVPQTHQIFCCAFNANGTVFVTGSSDNLARVWNACKSNTDDSDQPNHEMDVLSGHENDVNYVQFSGCVVASRFSVADTSKEENITKFKNSWFTHDNIVTCSRDGSAIIWIPRARRSHGKVGRWTRAYHLKVPPPPMPPQPPRGGPRQRILPTPRGVNMIVWSLDNRFVLAAIMDCRICVWNAADGSLVHSLTGHTASTYVLDVHPFNPRMAMSAGYDGKTIVWDIWEGMPIRIFEMGSHFKLVDGKFSSDGTSIILSDDVGQLYILNTGQGESQKDAKYDQFFLGDYRPLIQDTHGNVLDQETQLVPYRRNMQDLLCDSGMIPYPEPYQSLYQQRRLGALGLEWRPPSQKLAIGTDFTLDQDYHMLPLPDLDILIDPLPEFIDVMDWEPEIEAQSDDTDSEYNVTEEYSTAEEQGSIVSISSGDTDCSAEDSDDESSHKDGLRRSRRKKQKGEIEIMTSSGRRVKRRNLDECDGNLFRKKRTKKSRSGRKASRKKSFTSTSLRPQRAAARNARTLFSQMKRTSIDGEDEDGSEDSLSGSESVLHSNSESDDSDVSLRIVQSKHSKGKEVISDESEDVFKSHERPESHKTAGNRGRLILKLPNRAVNKPTDSVVFKYDNQEGLVGSPSKAPEEAVELNRNYFSSQGSGYSGDINFTGLVKGEIQKLEKGEDHLDLSEGYKDGKIRWGGVKARSSKRPRVGEAVPLDAFVGSSLNFNGQSEKIVNGNIQLEKECGTISVHSETHDHDEEMDKMAVMKEHFVGGNSEGLDGTTDGAEDLSLNKCRDCNESRELGHMITDHAPASSVHFNNGSDRTSSDLGDGVDKLEAQIDREYRPVMQDPPKLHSRPDKMYNAVYKRSKFSRTRTNSEDNGGGMEESTSNASDNYFNPGLDFHEATTDGVRRTRSMGLKQGHGSKSTISSDQSPMDRYQQTICEEWRSSSKTTVGLRSTRNRKPSYHVRDTSPVDRRKSHQSGKKPSWLLLSEHEPGSRYIPQQGDDVVYLRQGHQEYIEYISSAEVGPWGSFQEEIRAFEFCKVEGLDYATLPGSGASCCKMTIQFVDPTSRVFSKRFKLTLPEVTSFPDFLVERSRFDAAIHRNWTHRDKCKVWWKNEGEEDGSWWEGRILAVKPKSLEFPDSPWERYSVQYKSDPTETHCHSPWELFDTATKWEQPRIDDDITDHLLSSFPELEQPVKRDQDYYGIQKLKQASQKSKYLNRFSVPLSLGVIQSRLRNSYYRSMDALKHDIRVMLENAESYFEKNAEVSAKISRLSSWFTRTLSSL